MNHKLHTLNLGDCSLAAQQEEAVTKAAALDVKREARKDRLKKAAKDIQDPFTICHLAEVLDQATKTQMAARDTLHELGKSNEWLQMDLLEVKQKAKDLAEKLKKAKAHLQKVEEMAEKRRLAEEKAKKDAERERELKKKPKKRKAQEMIESAEESDGESVEAGSVEAGPSQPTDSQEAAQELYLEQEREAARQCEGVLTRGMLTFRQNLREEQLRRKAKERQEREELPKSPAVKRVARGGGGGGKAGGKAKAKKSNQ